MKTTLIIPDDLVKTIKKVAADAGETISYIVAQALRQGLHPNAKKKVTLEPLPTFKMGKTKIDLSDRDALYQVMEGKHHFRR